MAQHPESMNNNDRANKTTKADDFDKEKAAADQAESNTEKSNDVTTAPAEDDVVKEQKETD